MKSVLREDVERLFEMVKDGKLTIYRISKDLNMNDSYLGKLKNGQRSIDGIRLETAEILSNYYNKIKENM